MMMTTHQHGWFDHDCLLRACLEAGSVMQALAALRSAGNLQHEGSKCHG